MVPRIAFAAALAVSLGGCAQVHLDQAEKTADQLYRYDTRATLGQLAVTIQQLSRGYSRAARSTVTVQDALSLVISLSAVGALALLAEGAPTEEIAPVVVAGVSAGSYGSRYVSQSDIEAIYDGARRLNCVATVAAFGDRFTMDASDRNAAIALTIGAVEEIRISTRKGLVDELGTYTSRLEGYADAITETVTVVIPQTGPRTEGILDDEETEVLEVRRERTKSLTLDKFAERLGDCLEAGS